MIFRRRPSKEEGISCVVRAKNEENWLRMSLLSVRDFPDEIIFVDNASSDRTLEIARQFQEEDLQRFFMASKDLKDDFNEVFGRYFFPDSKKK